MYYQLFGGTKCKMLETKETKQIASLNTTTNSLPLLVPLYHGPFEESGRQPKNTGIYLLRHLHNAISGASLDDVEESSSGFPSHPRKKRVNIRIYNHEYKQRFFYHRYIQHRCVRHDSKRGGILCATTEMMPPASCCCLCFPPHANQKPAGLRERAKFFLLYPVPDGVTKK